MHTLMIQKIARINLVPYGPRIIPLHARQLRINCTNRNARCRSPRRLQGEVGNNPRRCRILDPAAASWTDRDKPLTVTKSDKKESRKESQTLHKNPGDA